MNTDILFIANTFYNLYHFRLPLLKALKDKGYKIALVSIEDEFYWELKKIFPVYVLKHLDRKGVNPIKEIILLSEIVKLLKDIRPKLVINITIKPNIWGNIAAGLLKIPSIGIVTGLGSVFVDKKFPIYELTKGLYKLSFRFPQRVIFQNNDDAELFINNNLIDPSKVRVILGSGIDLNWFKPGLGNKKDLLKDRIVFGYIGRLLWDKGLRELIEAAKLLKKKNYKFEILIVGKPDEGNPKSVSLKEIQKWEKEGLVTYKGYVRDVRPFLEVLDCFIYPSYYREGIPRAILEAMAMEKPVITTNTVGCKETVIDGVNGFLVPPKDSIALAHAMEKFINLPAEKRLEMGKKSRELAREKFELNKIINQYIQVIEEVLNKI